MKIAVIGAGAIGSSVAAYLTKAGCDVTLIARQAQVDAIVTQGLTIRGTRGEENFKVNVQAKMDKAVDLTIFATKSQDLEDAYQHNNEFLDTGLILTTQNGVQGDNLLSVHFERERQLSSIVMFGATYISPNEIVYNFDGDWVIGRPFTPLDPTAHRIGETLGKAFNVVMATNIVGQKYLKLFVNFNNCIPALLGKSMQETFSDMEMCRLSILLLKEGLGIIQEAGIALESMTNFPKERILGLAAMPTDQAAAIIQKTLMGLSKEPLYGSILQSIMRQRASEIDFINGEVVRLAKHLKIAVPLNERVVDMVHDVERTGQYFEIKEVKKRFNLGE